MFYVLNGTVWDSSYYSNNLSVQLSPDGNTNIKPLPDTNTTGEQLIFKVVDWLGVNITHMITVIVTPINDEPVIIAVNGITLTSHYLDLINNQFITSGANEDLPFNLTVEAFDKESNELLFTHVSSRNFIKSIGYNNSFIMNYSFVPDNTMVGIVQINITINETNDLAIPGDWVLINITVNNTNDEPLVTSVNNVFQNPGSTVEFLGDNGVFVGDTINITITAIDIDIPHGDILSFNISTPLPRGSIQIIKLGTGAVITERIANISFIPDKLDEGIQLINVTVQDTENAISYIILKIEVKDARKQYTLTEKDVNFDYDERGLEDDYAFYELVYHRPETQMDYKMMAFTRRGNVPGVDIVNLYSRKVGDYLNISINILSPITETTIIRLYLVPTTIQPEPSLDFNSKTLPDTYMINQSDYFLSLSYNDPNIQLPADITSTVVGNNILKFSMHLGVLQNDYGISPSTEFGLFAQAYRRILGGEQYDYYAYDSIGLGAAEAPLSTESYLLTHIECTFEERDTTDDEYGYNLEFKNPDRASGVKLISTARGGHPEIDILKITGERVEYYFEVTLNLATKVSNKTKVRYIVYIVQPDHNETGPHLTPNKLTDDSYPMPYSPTKDDYLHLAEYNNGTAILADKTAVDKNKLTFSFHLVRMQHTQLINLSRGTPFGIFAIAIFENNTGSALEYGFYYDTAGFGAAPSPTMVLEPVDDTKDDEEDKGFLYILGHIGGIPILLLIIIIIIIICIIAGYAGYVKSKYGGADDIDVAAVPPIPSARSAQAPDYGLSPGRIRDERYYDALYKEEYELAYGTGEAGYAGMNAGMTQRDMYGYDVLPDEQEEEEVPMDEETGELAPELPSEPVEGEEELEMPEIMLPPEDEEIPTEELTEEEMDLLVSPDELISEDVEAELKELEQAEEEQEPIEPEEEIADDETGEDFEETVEDEEEPVEAEDEETESVEEEEQEEDETGEDEDFELDESEIVESEEPVEDIEPVDEDEPVDEIEPMEEEEEPVEEGEEPVEEGEPEEEFEPEPEPEPEEEHMSDEDEKLEDNDKPEEQEDQEPQEQEEVEEEFEEETEQEEELEEEFEPDD
jgi:hypothetical protein